MAEYIPKSQKVDTTCPVCLDGFKRPRSLPCLHTFCSTCLQGYITNTSQNSLLSGFFCPVCRAQTKPPKPYSQRDTWAEQFPVNYWIVSFMQETEKEQSKDDVIMCEIHPDFSVRLFCVDHQCICCPLCVATEHRKCNDVKELADFVDQVDTMHETELFKESIKSSLAFFDAIRRDRNERIVSFVNKREELICKVRAKKEEISNRINAMETNALASIEETTENSIEDIENDIEWCNVAEETMNECKQIINDTVHDDYGLKSFITLSKIKTKSNGIIEAVKKKANEQMKTVEIGFEFSDGIEKFQDNCTDFGRVIVTCEDATESPHNASNSNEEDPMQNSSILRDDTLEEFPSILEGEQSQESSQTIRYADEILAIGSSAGNEFVKFVGQLSTSDTMSERKCWVTSILAMSNDCLIISDKTCKSLKMLKGGKIISEAILCSSPWDIARLSEARIAVTYPMENLVRIFDVYLNDVIIKFIATINILGSPLRCESNLFISEPCFGITNLRKNLIVSCEDSLRMYSKKGKLLHTLSQEKDGQALFRRATYLAADKFRDVVFVSDEGNNSVLAVQAAHKSLISTPKYIYKHGNLRCPQGIGVADDGSILVCGFGSKNIHKISVDGKLVNIIEIAIRPWFVTYLAQPNQIAVSVYPESEDCRHIYCLAMKNT